MHKNGRMGQQMKAQIGKAKDGQLRYQVKGREIVKMSPRLPEPQLPQPNESQLQ